MTLPASGPISLLMIRTEFGGAAPDSISEYYRGGGLVPDTPANASIPTSGSINFADFYSTSAVTVNVSNHSITGQAWQEVNPDPPPGQFNRDRIVQLTVNSNGVLSGHGSIAGLYPDGGSPNMTTTNYSGEWLPSGTASAYECIMQQTGGAGIIASNPSPLNTWLNCGTTRSWSVLSASGATGLLSFRPAGGGATIDSATITFV